MASVPQTAVPNARPVRNGLVYPENSHYLVVHGELVRAVGDDFDKAAILSALEYRSRMHDGEFQLTVTEIHRLIQRCTSVKSIRLKINDLTAAKLLSVRPGNRYGDWYTVELDKIQEAIRLQIYPGKSAREDPGKSARVSIKTSKTSKPVPITAAAVPVTTVAVAEMACPEPEPEPISDSPPEKPCFEERQPDEPDPVIAEALVSRQVASYRARRIASQVPRERAMYVINAVDRSNCPDDYRIRRLISALEQPERWPDYQPPPPLPQPRPVDQSLNLQWAYESWRDEQEEQRLAAMDPVALDSEIAAQCAQLRSERWYDGMSPEQRRDVALTYIRRSVRDSLPSCKEWTKQNASQVSP